MTSEELLLINDLSSNDPKVKYSSAKKLTAFAKDNPSRLYPYFDSFIKLMDSKNNILKWNAIRIIGHLAKVDSEKKVDKLLNKLFWFLSSGNLILANNTIAALVEIALAKPEHQDEIMSILLKVEQYNYETNECRNIALGKVVLALDACPANTKNRKGVIEFVQRQTQNTRNATKKKAEQFLKKSQKLTK